MPVRKRFKYKEDGEYISDGAIKRIARKAGLSIVSGQIFLAARTQVLKFVDEVIQTATTFAEHNRRYTIRNEEMLMALEKHYMKYYPTGAEDMLTRCKRFETLIVEGKLKKMNVEREIKHYQKQDMCLQFSMSGFDHIVRNVAMEYRTTTRFTKSSVMILQFVTEEYLVKLFADALLVAANANRTTVNQKDIELVIALRFSHVRDRF